MTIDYRKLLKKYIEHVGYLKDVIYVTEKDREESCIDFTEEEWEELYNLYINEETPSSFCKN